MLRKRRLCKQQAVCEGDNDRKALKIDIGGVDRRVSGRLTKNSGVKIRQKSENKTIDGRNDKLNSLSEIGQNESFVGNSKSQSNSPPASYRTNDSQEKSNNHVSKTFRLDSGYGSDPDESDYFEIMGLETSSSLDEPDCVSPESPWFKGSAGTGPAEIKAAEDNLFFRGNTKTCSEAFIDHEHKTDNPRLGDRFGAWVWTDTSSRKDGYYRHFFDKVQSGSPAFSMHIQNEDEIVLINDRFVPGLDHEAIMKLISRVPVDGVTRFELVLRRLISPPNGKNWIWFETSALLVPELRNEPRAADVRRVPLKNNMWDKTTYHRYKVIGTQKYLGICSEGVIVGKLTQDPKQDSSKTICKHAKVCEDPKDPSKVRYVTSLSCVDGRFYAAINENTNNACITTTEVFFEYGEIGSEIYFLQNKVYLCCINNKICASSERRMFEQLPTPGHKDVCDRNSNLDDDVGMDMVDGANIPPCGPPDDTNTSSHGSTNGRNTAPCGTPNGVNGTPIYTRNACKRDNLRDSGYGTSSPSDTPPRHIMTRALSKQLSFTSGLQALSVD